MKICETLKKLNVNNIFHNKQYLTVVKVQYMAYLKKTPCVKNSLGVNFIFYKKYLPRDGNGN